MRACAPITVPLRAHRRCRRQVHGNVAATFNIRIVQAASGRRLEIRPSSNDSKITFEPVAGTVTPAEAGSITTQVRHAVREQFTLVPVDLPSQFPFGGFKGVGTDAAQALALGLQLSGAAPGAAGLQAVTQSIAPSGFAFAVSKAFVTTVFQPALDSLKQFKQDVPGPGSVTFHVSVTNALADFNNGSIDLRITGESHELGISHAQHQYSAAVHAGALSRPALHRGSQRRALGVGFDGWNSVSIGQPQKPRDRGA